MASCSFINVTPSSSTFFQQFIVEQEGYTEIDMEGGGNHLEKTLQRKDHILYNAIVIFTMEMPIQTISPISTVFQVVQFIMFNCSSFSFTVGRRVRQILVVLPVKVIKPY